MQYERIEWIETDLQKSACECVYVWILFCGFECILRSTAQINQDLLYQQGLTEITAWISNYNHNFLQDILTHLWHNPDSGYINRLWNYDMDE